MQRAGQRSTEHDDSDRRFFAGLLIVIGLLAAALALVDRYNQDQSSRAGDRCPTTSSGGLVAFDAETGEVRWTNVVPPDGDLQVDARTGEIRLTTARGAGADDRFHVTTRTIDPDSGSVTACATTTKSMGTGELAAWPGDQDPLEPPIQLAGLTVAKFANGIRATDQTNTGVWSLRPAVARVRIGDQLVITRSTDLTRTSLLDLRTGERAWSVGGVAANAGTGGQPVLTTPAAGDRRRITAHDPADGSELWTRRIPSSPEAIGRPAAFVLDDLIVAPTGGGSEVIALDATSGAVRWNADGGSPGRSRGWPDPGVVDRAVRTPDGTTVIVAVDATAPYPQFD